MTWRSRTFVDVVNQFKHASPSGARELFVQNSLLFKSRPDMFATAIDSIPWRNGLAMLHTAYLTQPMQVEPFEAALRSILKERGSWYVSVAVLKEAIHSLEVVKPSMFANTVRAMETSKAWEAALRVCQVAERGNCGSRALLLAVAQSCASPASWNVALKALQTAGGAALPEYRDVLCDILLSAPWNESLRLITWNPMQKALGEAGLADVAFSTFPWRAALNLFDAAALTRANVPQLVGLLRRLPPPIADQAVHENAQIPLSLRHDPRLLEAALFTSIRTNDWQRALRQCSLLNPLPNNPPMLSRLLLSLGDPFSTGLPLLERIVSSQRRLDRKGWQRAVRILTQESSVSWQQSLGWLAAMQPKLTWRELLDDKSLSLLIYQCCRQGQPRRALELKGGAGKHNLNLLASRQVQALIFCQMYGRWHEALTMHARMPDHAKLSTRPLIDAILAERDNAASRIGEE